MKIQDASSGARSRRPTTEVKPALNKSTIVAVVFKEGTAASPSRESCGGMSSHGSGSGTVTINRCASASDVAATANGTSDEQVTLCPSTV